MSNEQDQNNSGITPYTDDDHQPLSVQPMTDATANPNPGPAPAAQQNKPHPLAGALDAVLKQATGGDVYYTDPQGNRKLSPQSRGNLGKTLIAATLAGMLAPDSYRQTPYGPVRDYNATAGNAAGAASEVIQKRRDTVQKLSDDQQSRKLMTIQNNSHLIALQSASARMKHENQEQNAAAVETTLTPFKEYESTRDQNDPKTPKAFMAQGLTHNQVLAKGPDGKPSHNLTDSNVIQDGWIEKYNEETKQMEPEPTYAVLNPDLKDIQLPPQVTDMLSKTNSQWKDIHAVVGGSVRIPVNAYVSAMHDYSAVMQGQKVLESLNESVNGKDAKELSVDAVAQAARMSRDKGTNLLPALYQLSHAVAGGNLPEDGQRPDNLIHTLLTSPNSVELLKLIGLTPEEASKKADAINNERVKANALAKEGGIGDKSPAPQEQVDATMKAVKTLPPDEQQALMGDFNPNGPTVGELKHINDKVQSAMQANKTRDIQAGDPVVLQQTANNMIEGDTSGIKDMTTTRSNVRAKFDNILQTEARRRGLDPTRYTVSATQAKSDMYKEFSGTSTKTGANLLSFNTLLGHVAEGIDANDKWARSNSPITNHAISWIAKNATNDPDFKRFQSDIIAPAKEYMNFLNQNRAEHEQDIKSLSSILDENSTPQGALVALKEFMRTADIRAAQYGQKYLQTVGTTYPVVNGSSIAALDRILGPGQSLSAKVSRPIPRGWQNGQATPLNDRRVLSGIFEAAGRDPEEARRIARENGWVIPSQSGQ